MPILCKDCAHVLPSMNGRIDDNARCALFKGPVNPVTGEQAQAYAQNARSSPNSCGAQAIRFEPRQVAA